MARALATAIVREPAVRGIELAPGSAPGRLDGAELAVTLVVEPGTAPDEVRAAVQRVNVHWSTDPVVVAAVDSLAVRVAAATTPHGAPPEAPAADTVDEPRGLRGWLARRGRKGHRPT